MGTTTRVFNWRELVEAIDDENRQIESLYPIVYIFSGESKKRDKGPNSIIYKPTP